MVQASLGLAAVLLLVSCSDSPEVKWFKSQGYDESEIAQITVDHMGRPVIPIEINDTTLTAIFDTGMMTGLVVSTVIANHLKLPQAGRSNIPDPSGLGTRRALQFGVSHLEALDRMWTDINATGLAAYGSQARLGAELLDVARWTISFGDSLMAISDEPLEDATMDGISVPMIRSPQYPGLILIEGTINGGTTLFVLNTGNAHSSVHPAWAQLLKLDSLSNGFHADHITIGDYEFPDLYLEPKYFTELERGFNRAIKGSIGADILADLRITVDYEQQRVYLSRRDRKDDKPVSSRGS